MTMTPANKSYTIPVSGTLNVGRVVAPTGPTWAAAAPLNAWMEIPGTSGAGGADATNYGGWAKLPNGNVAITLTGGHSDAKDNRTVVIDLLADSPAWSLVGAPTPFGSYVLDTDYQPDGKPTSSHIYHTAMWLPPINRLARVGCVFASGGLTMVYPHVDGFNLTTNTWDAAGTHPDIPGGGSGCLYQPSLGKVLIRGDYDGNYMDPVTGGMTALTISGGLAYMPRFPWAWDSTRNQAVGFCFGDGQGYGSGITAAKIVGTTATPITINASAALTQYLADVPIYTGMDYDPVNDYFLTYEGNAARVGRVYKVTPNGTSVWDMSIFSYGSGGVTPVAGNDLMNKFSYIPELKGFVMMATKASNLYFMRTA